MNYFRHWIDTCIGFKRRKKEFKIELVKKKECQRGLMCLPQRYLLFSDLNFIEISSIQNWNPLLLRNTKLLYLQEKMCHLTWIEITFKQNMCSNNNRTFEMSSVECWRKRRMSWMISSMSKWKLVSNWRRTLRSRRRCWSMTPQTPPSVESSFRRTICSSGTSKKASEDDGGEDGSSVRACLTSINCSR